MQRCSRLHQAALGQLMNRRAAGFGLLKFLLRFACAVLVVVLIHRGIKYGDSESLLVGFSLVGLWLWSL